MRAGGSMSHRSPFASVPAVVGSPQPQEPDESHETHEIAPALVGFLSLGGLYLLAVGSMLFAPEGTDVAAWWPVSGAAVALLVLAPRRNHWLLALGVAGATGLASFTGERSLETALGFGLANGAEALLVAWLVTRGREGRPSLRTMDDLWRFLLAALLGAVVAAAGIGLTVAYALDGSLTRTATTVGASHLASILLIAPLALRAGPSTVADRRPEALAQALLLLASVGLVFRPDQELSLTFAPLPLLLWAALRFGLRVVSFELVAVGVLTTALTAAGGGPFAAAAASGLTTEATAAALTQTFLVATALVALPLVVAVDQRRSALTQVAHSEELFHKSFSESFVGMLLLSLAPDGVRIRELNQTAADILGRPLDQFRDELLQPLLETRTSFKDVAEQMRSAELAGWREELWLTTEPGRRVAFAMSPMTAAGEEMMFSAQMMDVTDVYDATTRLRTEKDFTSAVLNTTACLIVVLDVEGRIAGLNPAGEKLSGRTEAEVLDKPLWGTLAPTSDQNRVRNFLDRTRPSRDTVAFESDLLTTEGERRRIVWSAAPLTNDTGRRTHVVLTGLDVTDERNVRSMTNHLLDVATSTAFIGVNLVGTITIFNAGAQELLGYSADEVTGQLQLEALHDPEQLARAAQRAGATSGFAVIVAGVGEGPQTRDWAYVRKDGSRVACVVTMSAVHDAFGTHIGYLAVARDMTDSQRSQKLLVETLEKEREATERLRDLDRAKSDFVSLVSHELRTPITSIIGYTEMLQDGAAGPVAPAQDRLLDAVRRNGERLIAMIEDLLTLSRIEAGTFTLEKRPVDLRSVFERAHETLEPMLVGRQLDLHFELPDHPVLVLGDSGQLERVVVNVLENAVKFTEDGGRVEWALTSDGGEAEIRVVDTGIGIPESEQPGLFSRFFRSSTAQERAIQGTGLGLTISQWIVHGHGGEIAIRSRPHVGTEVRVVLPVAQASPARYRLDAGP